MQFHVFEQAHARDWRAIAGPENSDAPLKFRNEVWVHDRRVAVGETVTLPRREAWLLWLHLFKGAGCVGHDLQLTRGDSVVVDKPATFMAGEISDLVAFLVDPSAPYSLAGSLSGRA